MYHFSSYRRGANCFLWMQTRMSLVALITSAFVPGASHLLAKQQTPFSFAFFWTL